MNTNVCIIVTLDSTSLSLWIKVYFVDGSACNHNLSSNWVDASVIWFVVQGAWSGKWISEHNLALLSLLICGAWFCGNSGCWWRLLLISLLRLLLSNLLGNQSISLSLLLLLRILLWICGGRSLSDWLLVLLICSWLLINSSWLVICSCGSLCDWLLIDHWLLLNNCSWLRWLCNKWFNKATLFSNRVN